MPGVVGVTLGCRSVQRLQGAAACRVHHPAHRDSIVCRAATTGTTKLRRKSGFTYAPPPFDPEQPPQLKVELAMYDTEQCPAVDVAIAGAGPAGLATAARIAAAGLTVAVVDPNPLAHWPNNYGVWSDEFEAMGLQDCFEKEWPSANVWLGERQERFLNRRYARVDRLKLKKKLVAQCMEHKVQFHYGRASGCKHEPTASMLSCQDGTKIRARLVVDATGHARRLVKFEGTPDPGYQAAYGIMAEVESHPFELDKMLFMDWRDAHLRKFPAMRKANEAVPTFLYAMPFTKTRVFLEETSLVARPAVPFEECKDRLFARLRHMGVKVTKIVEEEYCLIPMGSTLPVRGQRVIGVGGTAGLVHPSTGYMVARTLGAVPQLADRIVDELAGRSAEDDDKLSPEEINARASRIWESIWPSERLLQREFFNFGMEVLLKLDLAETRQFFTAFFSLSDFHWQGFLSSRLSFGELFIFGLSLFANASNAARLDLMQKGIPGLGGLAVNLAKLAK